MSSSGWTCRSGRNDGPAIAHAGGYCYSYSGLAKYIAGTHRSAFAMLIARRGDYLIDYASAASDVLGESPIPSLRSHAIDRLDIHLVLSRAYPDAEAVMNRLEEIVKTLDVVELLKGRHDAR